MRFHIDECRFRPSSFYLARNFPLRRIGDKITFTYHRDKQSVRLIKSLYELNYCQFQRTNSFGTVMYVTLMRSQIHFTIESNVNFRRLISRAIHAFLKASLDIILNSVIRILEWTIRQLLLLLLTRINLFLFFGRLIYPKVKNKFVDQYSVELLDSYSTRFTARVRSFHAVIFN